MFSGLNAAVISGRLTLTIPILNSDAKPWTSRNIVYVVVFTAEDLSFLDSLCHGFRVRLDEADRGPYVFDRD